LTAEQLGQTTCSDSFIIFNDLAKQQNKGHTPLRLRLAIANPTFQGQGALFMGCEKQATQACILLANQN
jgi:hypothetical protein